MNKTYDNRHLDIYWLIGILLISIAIGFSLRSIPGYTGIASHDSSMFQYFGRLMNHGYVPYVDMFDHKGPLLFFINALGHVSFHGIEFLWFIETISIFVTLMFTYLSARFFVHSGVAGVAVLITSVIYVNTLAGGNYSEEYALPLISISLFFLGRFFIKKDFRIYIPFLFGLTGVLVIFLRANMIILWVIGTCAVIGYLIVSKNNEVLWKMILYAALGAILAAVPFFIYCLMTNSLSQMIYQAFKFNVLYVKYTSGVGLNNVLSFFAKLFIDHGWMLIIIGQPWVFFEVWQNREKNSKWYLASVYSYGLLNIISVLLSQREYPHYLLTEIPFLIIIVALLISEIFNLSRNKRLLTFASIILVTVLMAVPSLKLLGQTYTQKNVPFYWTRDTQLVANYIKQNTSSKDTIYVHEKDANIYNIAKRKSNSRFFTLPAVNLDKFPRLKKEFIQGLSKRKPVFIVTWAGFLKQKQYKVGTSQYELQRIIMHKYKNTYNDYFYNVYKLK
ncbi:glycosyltransferase family 39 protein [Pediococcus parvulus]|uniref:glycosyltransferase family 39 protein n=1 Tax=Pediococcus parvulus TaxID=54062 RepID=UPI0021A39FB2|nr:glycosyltransferase family 39 protein [Pediococcus parvulus]MCT3033884.1 hypothetical protein [Pediococcus parvulus]